TAVKSDNIPYSIKTSKDSDTNDLNVVVDACNHSRILECTTDQPKIVSINRDCQVTAEAEAIATVKATLGNMSD
ncbi:hypothetical protein, partial [Staphylococcus aureus]